LLRRPAKKRRRARALVRRFAIATVVLTTLGGLTIASRFGFGPDLSKAGNQLLIAGGLGIQSVTVTGYQHTSLDEIFAALGTDAPVSLVTFDASAARQRLGSLPWVQGAELTRQLPDGLSVRIEERRPFAVWQHRNMLFVIDREGRTLDPVGPSDYPQLPVVIGAGAAGRAPVLLATLAGHPNVASRLMNAQRIADRRWTLRLNRAEGSPPLEVLLPADDIGAAEALARLDAMIGEDRLLERRVATVDLRLPDRTAFRLEPEGKTAANRSTGEKLAALVPPAAVPAPATQPVASHAATANVETADGVQP
jgi:cell division protein FtsQ